MSLSFHILPTKKTLLFHITETWKRNPFWVESFCLGHYREYPPPPPREPPNRTWYSDIVRIIVANVSCTWRGTLNVRTISTFWQKVGRGLGSHFLGRFNWGFSVNENLACNAIQWFWCRKRSLGVSCRTPNGRRMIPKVPFRVIILGKLTWNKLFQKINCNYFIFMYQWNTSTS